MARRFYWERSSKAQIPPQRRGSLTNMVACPPNGVDQFAAFNLCPSKGATPVAPFLLCRLRIKIPTAHKNRGGLGGAFFEMPMTGGFLLLPRQSATAVTYARFMGPRNMNNAYQSSVNLVILSFVDPVRDAESECS